MRSADTTPSTETTTSAKTAGFTLIEMMAVMLIIALVSSLVVRFIPGTGRAGLNAITMDVMAMMRRERLDAILTARDRYVSLDSARRIFVGDGGEAVSVPADVTLDILGADAVLSGKLAVIQFHPDGSSSGAAIKMSREGVAYEVRVNWYTGGVALETE